MPEQNNISMARTARTRRIAGRRAGAAGARRLLLAVLRFLAINILFFAVTSPFVVWYGPFPNIKNAIVGSIGHSRHQYWLRYIGMSQQEINSLFGYKTPGSSGPTTGINVPAGHNSEVTLTRIRSKSFRYVGYLLEVKDSTRIRLGVTSTLGVKGETTSEIARDNGAVAAVNAGGFDDPAGTGTGKTPYGIVIHNGVYLHGANMEGKIELVGMDNRGVLVTGSYSKKEIRDMNIREAISFWHPTLIKNGEKKVTSEENANGGISPRTAIGQKLDGTILLLAIDGRQTDSLGATLLDVQNILYGYGAWTAANLDGGSSTTMYFNGKVINQPCDPLGERLVPTAWVVI